MTHQVWIHGDAEYLDLSLEPDLIHISASELVNTESIELIPQHCVCDPLIATAGIALKSQLELASPFATHRSGKHRVVL